MRKNSGNTLEELRKALSETEQHKREEKLRIRQDHEVECRRKRDLGTARRKKIKAGFESTKRDILKRQQEMEASDQRMYDEFDAEIKESQGDVER